MDNKQKINWCLTQILLGKNKDEAAKKLVELCSKVDEPEFIDLGLPSGTLWCSCNLGANSPEEPGNMYMWGDHTPYFVDDSDFENSGNLRLIDKEGEVLDYSNWIHHYKYIIAGDYEDVLTKYNHLDYRTELIPIDDTAYQYNKEWRVPTPEEIQELLDNTVQEIVKEERGVTTFKFISTINGNYIYVTYIPYISDRIIMSNALTDTWGENEAYKVILAAAVTYSGGIQLTDHISYGTFFRYSPSPIRPVKHGNVNKNYITIDLGSVITLSGNTLQYAYTKYAKLANAAISGKPIYDIANKSFLTNLTIDEDGTVEAYLPLVGDYNDGEDHTFDTRLRGITATPDGTISYYTLPV